MNILQLLTIHTSVQIRPLVVTRKLIQMYCCRRSQHAPIQRDRGLQAVPTIVFIFQLPSLYANCNLPILPVVLLPWHGFRGEDRRGISKQLEILKSAKQIRKGALCIFPLGEVQLVSSFCLSEGLFVLFDSGLDAFTSGR